MSALGTLYVVASHLGNASDLGARALETLRDVEVLYAEDTRTARRLLASHGVDRAAHSCFDANEADRAVEAAELLRQGKSIAVLSEAGTPTVSDPGYRIVRAALDVGARIVPIPGPSALLAALVGSGLPPDRFLFAGFPPRKSGSRRELFAGLRALPFTLIFYESPHRVGETLSDLVAAFGDHRPACVARELTKLHEEFVRGTLGELALRYADARPLGEITMVVGGAPAATADAADDDALRARAGTLLAAGSSPRDVAALLAAETGRPKREIYALVLGIRHPPG